VGAPATYLLNIKDITYVSSTVDMTVQLGQYMAQSYQNPATVSNELLSDITIPGTVGDSALSWSVDCDGSITYIPYDGDAFLKSATCTEGFQYAVAYLFTNVYAGTGCNGGYLVASCQYSYNGNDWYDSSIQSLCRVMAPDGVTNHYAYMSAQYLIPGNVDPVAVWIRWKMSVYGDTGSGLYVFLKYSITLDVIPRHTHTWQQTGQAPSTMQAIQVDDASQVGATPETITCAINGGAPFAITCAAPSYANNLDIKPQLVTGVNTIVFTSTVKCSITPTATLLVLPT